MDIISPMIEYEAVSDKRDTYICFSAEIPIASCFLAWRCYSIGVTRLYIATVW
jgi:hypothetical protein